MNEELLALAAGTIVTGFEGTSLDGEVRALLQRAPFAGFILFARNIETIEQTRALTGELRGLADTTPIVAIDQEGGRIARLARGVEVVPPMMALGATGDPALASECAAQMAHDLRRAGCNLDFAPVLDLAVDPRNTVIGTRAFGASPELVERMGLAFAQGMRGAGIIPVVKHFPGHGATAFDTHLGPARLDADLDTLERRDLVPFARACEEGVDAIMAAHVAVDAIDGDVPASLSHRMLTGVLRERWHYDGVCFTDCLQMDAIARGIGTAGAVGAAIGAGADCALVSHDPRLAYDAAVMLANAVERGETPRLRLEEAYRRVQRLRAALQPPLPLDQAGPHPGIGARIASDAVTLVRGTLPVERDRPIAYSYRAHLDDAQARRIDAMLERDPETVVVSIAEPFDLARFPQARTQIACYSNDEVMLGAVRAALFDGVPCSGRLPL